jgi:putative hydrolase of the HAD superfamily
MGESVIVFDLDDTLTDWWTAIRAAAEEAADEWTASQFSEVVQHEAWTRRDDGAVHRAHWRLRVEPLDFWRQLVSDSEAEAVAERFLERLRPRLYEDVVPTLQRLSPDTELGVLTNSPFVDQELKALEIADWFSTVVGVSDPIRKPHPDAFRRLFDELGGQPNPVWYVGDSPVADVEPARRHGMKAVWLDRFSDGWTPPNDVAHVRSLEELVDLVDLPSPR